CSVVYKWWGRTSGAGQAAGAGLPDGRGVSATPYPHDVPFSTSSRPPPTLLHASSHGDGASRADISPQASDGHDASTDLSLTPQSTDIIKPAEQAAGRREKQKESPFRSGYADPSPRMM
ncbi:Piwi-like protein 2, partial [Dissostichus eleginoides]